MGKEDKMNEFILIIVILTSNGWIENEVTHYPRKTSYYENFNNKQYCQIVAESITKHFHNVNTEYLTAYCKEKNDN